MSWASGETIVFRQVWRGRPWLAIPVVVISDDPGLLVTYLPERAPISCADGDWPGGAHPWVHREQWQGHGTLMLRRPVDRYSVWSFWSGEERQFECWYVNLEQPYRRSAIGFDTLDHELDLWSEDGRTWHLKDEDGVQKCVTQGRFDEREAQRTWADAADFQSECARNGPWWNLAWSEWQPPAGLAVPSLPAGWELVPAGLTAADSGHE